MFRQNEEHHELFRLLFESYRHPLRETNSVFILDGGNIVRFELAKPCGPSSKSMNDELSKRFVVKRWSGQLQCYVDLPGRHRPDDATKDHGSVDWLGSFPSAALRGPPPLAARSLRKADTTIHASWISYAI